MSRENVEVRNEAVRRFLATFDNDTDAFRDTLHPEIEWFSIEETSRPPTASKVPCGLGISGLTPGASTE